MNRRQFNRQSLAPILHGALLDTLLTRDLLADPGREITRNFEYPDLGVHTRMVDFPRIAGLPEDVAFIKKIFGMKQDRAIIPHGHKNMVSAH